MSVSWKKLKNANGDVGMLLDGMVCGEKWEGVPTIKNITDELWRQRVALGVNINQAVCFRVDTTSGSGVFGTASFTVIGWMSSVNYGYGIMISDNANVLAVFRRAGGPLSNYVYKVSLTQV